MLPIPVRSGLIVGAMSAFVLCALACGDEYVGSSGGGSCNGMIEVSGSFTCDNACPATDPTIRLQKISPDCPGLVTSAPLGCDDSTGTAVYTGSGSFGPVRTDSVYNYALTTDINPCPNPPNCNSLDCSMSIPVAGRPAGLGDFTQNVSPSYDPDISNFNGTDQTIDVTLLSPSAIRLNGTCAPTAPQDGDPQGNLCAEGGNQISLEVQGIEVEITTTALQTAKEVATALFNAFRAQPGLAGIKANVPTNLLIDPGEVNPATLIVIEAPITIADSQDCGIRVCVEGVDCPSTKPACP